MKLKYNWLLFLLLGNVIVYSQASLNVQGQQFGWGQGTIEEAQFTIQPRGIYMEVGMYLTFSARGITGETISERNLLNIEQDLETWLSFTLPLGTQVTDSWLWINDDIIQADIEERWHATRVYESVVGRRIDPSLLTKDNWAWHGERADDRYVLRVYPLQKDSTRRVKITYLTPGDWSNDQVSIPLPVDILKASQLPVDKISIQCFLNNEFSNPRILQLPSKQFIPKTHNTLGDHLQLFLTSKDIEDGLDISFTVPMEEGVFLSNYQEEGRDFYQLTVLPQEVFPNGINPPKKIAVLIDYDSIRPILSKEIVLATLEEQLLANLNPDDHFNVLFATPTGIQLMNPNWLAADEQIIQAVFSVIEETYQVSGESNIPLLLNAGMEFINSQNIGGSLLLLSNSKSFQDQEKADEYLSELNSIVANNTIPIHIADYQNTSQWSSSYGFDLSEETGYFTRWEELFGNEYFYLKLNELTGGHTQVIRVENTLARLLDNSLEGILNPTKELKTITISKNNGSCFNQFTLPFLPFPNVNTTFMQVGKCRGDFPFTIDLTGTVGDQIVTKSIVIEEPTINKGDKDHLVSWAGNYIYELEQNRPYGTLTQRIIEEIIEWSLEYRILSLYTAFLALEVDLGGYVCKECVDETLLTQPITDLSGNIQNASKADIDLPTITLGGETRGGGPWIPPLGDSIITATKDISLDTLIQITASPNPFKEGTRIEVQITQEIASEDAAFTIYDLNGRVVKSFAPQLLGNKQVFQFYWDGTNAQRERLSAGMYIFNIQTRIGQRHLKLLLVD